MIKDPSMKRLRNLLLLLLAALLLASCTSSVVNLSYEDGKLVNKRLGLSYVPAPTNYQPKAVGEEYAVYKKSGMKLYAISGLDPKEWLTEEYAGSATTVFHAEDITLPSLSEMGVTEIIVCSNKEITVGLTTISDQALIDALIDTFETGEQAYWPVVNAVRTYEMKFSSAEKYPHFYFNLIYGEFESGTFLYDRTTKKCVEIGDLLASALPTK